MKKQKIIKAYRIIEVRENNPYTLFHAVSNCGKYSRKIPVDTWLRADNKIVTDGSSQTKYLSGFNILMNLDRMEDYTKRFSKPRDLRIIEILVKNSLRPKEHSRSKVWLADWMYVPSNWQAKSIKVKINEH